MPRLRKPANPAEALVGVAPLAARWIERLLASGEPPLTLAQYLALRAIASEPLAAAELARRAGVSGAAVSQLVSTLESAGWVEREAERADRRRHLLRLTPAGLDAFQSASGRVHAGLGDVLAGLPPREARALTDLLVTLEHVLAGTPPPRRRPPPRP
jgi:DNA-binding MarR family transcriptional regulator